MEGPLTEEMPLSMRSPHLIPTFKKVARAQPRSVLPGARPRRRDRRRGPAGMARHHPPARGTGYESAWDTERAA
ncbi:MAG: hypothetical protein ACRDK8_08645, partial [Solirubrobacteraceae bacterium]